MTAIIYDPKSWGRPSQWGKVTVSRREAMRAHMKKLACAEIDKFIDGGGELPAPGRKVTTSVSFPLTEPDDA